MHPLELQIAQIAGRQDNLITWDQLVRIGIGRRAVARRVENGRWQRIHKAVYLIGPAPPTLSAKARAAAFTCGDGAAVSHRTAAVIWKLVPAPPEPELHITVPGRNPGVKPGIRIHRVAELASQDLAMRDAIPLTTPARTICDLAATEPVRDVESALAEARIHRLATDRQIKAVIARAPTRPGAPIIRKLLEAEADTGYTRS